jgi:hypothetical protein
MMCDADAAKENQLTGIGENEDFNRRSPLLHSFEFEMP